MRKSLAKLNIHEDYTIRNLKIVIIIIVFSVSRRLCFVYKIYWQKSQKPTLKLPLYTTITQDKIRPNKNVLDEH